MTINIDKEKVKENAIHISNQLLWVIKTSIKCVAKDKDIAISDLCGGLDNGNKYIRMYSCFMLLKLCNSESRNAVPYLICALADPEKNIQIMAAQILGNIGHKAKLAIFEIDNAIEKSTDPDFKKVLEDTKAKIASDVAGSFSDAIKELKHTNPRTRRYCAELIGSLGPKARNAIPFLAEHLKDPDASVRMAAVSALGKIGAASITVIPALCDIFTYDDDDSVKMETVSALLNIDNRSPEVFNRLSELLRTKSKDLREYTIGELGKTGKQAIPVLLPLLKDENPVMRRKAVQSFGDMGNEAMEVVSKLSDMLINDPDVFVRSLAKTSISKIKNNEGTSKQA